MSVPFESVVSVVADRLPPGISPAYLDAFVTRYRAAIRGALATVEAQYKASCVTAAASASFEDPVESWTKAKRTVANLAAMRLMADTNVADMTAADRQIIAGYSGWGGLELGPVADKFPEGFPIPEKRGLIHEYYTPARVCSEVARVLTPYLWDLEEYGGIQALEPAAGIGRFIRAFDGPPPLEHVGWTTIEYSEVSGKILKALNPGISTYTGPFERWVMDHGPEMAGTFNLVVSNPPYGARGPAKVEDSDRAYRTSEDGTGKKAYAYFMRRALDLLARGGIGVFLVPYGFLTGASDQLKTLRERILRRHHLMSAYRLPSRLFPGAMLVTDLLFFRARGGELPAVDGADLGILEGGYYALYPDHVLGTEMGTAGDDDDQQKKPRWGYQVDGTFTSLPDLVERPLCRACSPEPFEVFPKRKRKAERGTVNRVIVEAESGLIPEVEQAVDLGLRVDAFLAYLASDPKRARLLWYELKEALEAWVASFGNPRRHPGVLEQAATGVTGAERFLVAFEKTGDLIPGFLREPEVPASLRVERDDVVGIAEALFRQRHAITTFDVLANHRDLGGTWSLDQVVAKLRAAEWGHDGSEVYPPEVYYTGDLWPKFDRSTVAANNGDAWAAEQVAKITLLIPDVPLEEIDGVSPNQGWIPLDILSAWINEDESAFPSYGEERSRIQLERKDGLLQLVGVNYDRLTVGEGPVAGTSANVTLFLGWVNHDRSTFSPSRFGFNTTDEARLAKVEEWTLHFLSWCRANTARSERVEQAYARQFLGYIEPFKGDEPLDIVRWRGIPGKTVLRPIQNRAVRHLMQNRGGLCSLDVGVGKTLAGAAYIAIARQEGWARRPVVLVPNTIPWKWYSDVTVALPDFRIVVVGSNRVLRKRKGVMKLTSVLDTPEQRAEKWTRFQAGEFDMAIVTYSVFSRTRMNDGPLREYARHTEGIAREMSLRKKNIKKKGASKVLTEREDAVLTEDEAEWVAAKMELPKGQRFDPGIAWDDLGVDLLLVDEAQNYKNLYLPEPRSDNRVPDFMGNKGKGATRAWQLDFRASTVRRLTGGSGIVLLSATPAKNSPLELYNLIQYIDHGVWQRMGIKDPEMFIDRYCRIEHFQTINAKGKVVVHSAVLGFTCAPELRSVLFRYGEFVTAEQAKIPLPDQRPKLIEVDMNERQFEIYERLREEAEDEETSGGILVMIGKMAVVAIHPDLETSWTFAEAKEALNNGVVNPHSPKFDRCVSEIRKNRTCGHVVFVENVASHVWLEACLIEAGVKAERIAILNGQSGLGAEDKTRIAQEFNGSPEEDIDPKYDVLIANSVAYEGIDLQTRTCAIHHIDFSWEPATLHQRNGRGVRQGNTLETIALNYYFARRSIDGMRYEKIQGKRTWLVDLLESEDREINNPGASLKLSREELLLMLSNDPEKAEELMEIVREQKVEALRKATREKAIRSSRTANAMFRRAVSLAKRNPDKARRVRHEAEGYLKTLAEIDPNIWPWAGRVSACRDHEVWVTEGGIPLKEGDRIRVDPGPAAGSYATTHFFEIGKPTSTKIAVREAGTSDVITRDIKHPWWVDLKPANFDPEDWPTDDLEKSIKVFERGIWGITRESWKSWGHRSWNRAADTWLETLWSQLGDKILARMAKPTWGSSKDKVYVPSINEEGILTVGDPPEDAGKVIPPTAAGWIEFVNLVRSGAVAHNATPYKAATWWWGNSLSSVMAGQYADHGQE